ncbi:hypothetical protein AX16_004923 [Volvariella volvacea WC 439]|nr:hypothetical protein AX16_004923 [Volvariella volvacea WC 439]
MPSKKAKAKAKSKSKASSQSQSQSLPPTINTSATNVDASAILNPPSSSPTSSLPESRARTTLPPTSLPPSTELPVPPITVPSQNNQHIQAEPFSPPYFHHPEHDQAKSQNRSPDVASGGGGEGGGNAQPPSFLWTGDDSDGQGTPLNAADAELLETANRWYASTMQHLAEQEQQLRQHGRDQSSQQHDSHPHQHPPFTDEELFQILDAGFAASGGDLAASQLASRIISDKLFGAGAGVGIGGGASYAAAGTLDEEYWDSPHPHIRNLAQLMYSKIAQKHGQSTFPTGPTNSNPTAHSAHTPKSDNPNANRGSTQSKTPHPPFPLPGEFTFMATTGTTTTPSGEYETLSGGHGKSGQKGPVQYKMTASTMLPADPSLFSDPAMIKSIQDAAAALVSLPLPFPVSQHTIHTAEGAKVVIENAQSFEMSTTPSEGVKHVGRVQHQSIPQHGMGVVTGQMTLPVPMTVDGSGGVGSGTAVVAGGHVSITAETHGNATRKRDIKGKGRAEPAEDLNLLLQPCP